MGHSVLREANSCSAEQEIVHLLWKKKYLLRLLRTVGGTCPDPVKSTPELPEYILTFALILSSTLHSCLRSGLFTSGFSKNYLYLR